jgi:hypothetical protein
LRDWRAACRKFIVSLLWSARRVSHEHSHTSHEHHGHKSPGKRRIHHDWRFWAVIAMLVGMAIYVMTMDEAIAPGVQPGQEVPAAAE